MARNPVTKTKKPAKGIVPHEPAKDDHDDADLAAPDQPTVEIAKLPEAPKAEVDAIAKPALAAMVKEAAEAIVKSEVAKLVKVKTDTRDKEQKISVAELNKRHMDEKKKADADKNEAYLKAIAAVQMQFGIAPNTPVPQVFKGGHQVVPLGSPHAKQLAAQNVEKKNAA